MKKLVCLSEVKAAAAKGQKIFTIDCNTIVTPAAADMAKDLGLELVVNPAAVCGGLAPKGAAGPKPEIAIDRNLIYQIVKAVIANQGGLSLPEAPYQAEQAKNSSLKIVRGRTVKLETFDTGDPRTNVAYREVVSQDESHMSAGFLTIDKSSFDWQLDYEEIDIILEGSLSITVSGETFTACQGDVLFVPKGSKVTWSSTGHVKLFYITYPANWAEIAAKA